MDDVLRPLHRLLFARGSEALEFLRLLREAEGSTLRTQLEKQEPIRVYGALVVMPDAPAELYVTVGALSLAYAMGVDAPGRGARDAEQPKPLPADVALLFRGDGPSTSEIVSP